MKKKIFVVFIVLIILSVFLCVKDILAQQRIKPLQIQDMLVNEKVMSVDMSEEFARVLQDALKDDRDDREAQAFAVNLQQKMRNKIKQDYQVLIDLHDYLRNMSNDPIGRRLGDLTRQNVQVYKSQLDRLNKKFKRLDKNGNKLDLTALSRLLMSDDSHVNIPDIWEKILFDISFSYKEWNRQNNTYQKKLQKYATRIHMENDILSFDELKFIDHFEKIQHLIRRRIDGSVYNF